MNLSEEQILTLAPDESSKKSGKDLANSGKWQNKGANELAIWGECQGSGSKPYLTQIDTSDIAFKCSCPSRKFPCKHGLGLLLIYARNKNQFIAGDPPAWVTEWLSKRNEKQEKQAEKQSGQKDKSVDGAAQEKRQQARLSKVNDGIDELSAWLKDIVRNGIMSMPEKGFLFFENMSRRLIDAQAPGLANMVRSMGEINFYAESWPGIFVDQLARIYMITEGFRNSVSSEEKLLHDLKALIGFTVNQDELKESTGIADTWLVLGKQVIETDNVTTEKFWLYGAKTKHCALLMQFIVRGQGIQFNITPGMYMEAELVFFPSALPQRALVKRYVATTAVTGFDLLQNWQQVAESETEMNSALPFRNENVFIISKLKPVQYNHQWWLQDSEDRLMKLKNENRHIWNLLALSGGEPLDMAVIGKENQFEPLGIWHQNEYKII